MAGIPYSRNHPNQYHNIILRYLEESNMSSKTSSIISGRQERAIQDMSFEERVQLGAENAVLCMGVTAQDRVFIITDYERENLAQLVASAVLAQHAGVTVCFLEHYGERPLTSFPEALQHDLVQARPTVTYYIATAKPGEISFRIPLLPFLVQERNTKADLARFGGGDVVGDRRPRLHEVMLQSLGKRGEGAFPVMFQETHCDACMLSQDGARYQLREVFAFIIGDNEDTILRGDAHTKDGVFCPKLHTFFKRHVLDSAFLAPGDDATCFA